MEGLASHNNINTEMTWSQASEFRFHEMMKQDTKSLPQHCTD